MTKCPKCKFYNICKGRINETVENCVRFKSTEQTNEEWLRQCTTEQFAEWLRKHMNCNFCPMNLKCEDMRDCMEHIKAWLKQPHEQKGD